MSAFSKKTVKIENPGVWQAGEYVKVRVKQTVSDQKAIRGALLERVPDLAHLTDEELMHRAIDAQVVVLQRMIAEWKLFDDDGEEVPLTPENVAELDGDYADYILTKMGEEASDLSGNTMSEAEQDHFLASASARTKTS